MMERRTVLLLGAGASAASKYRLPTMSNFWPPSLDSISAPLAEFLRWFGTHTGGAYNLEDVLAYLDLARNRAAIWGVSATPRGVDPNTCFAAVLNDVRARLKTPLDHPCDIHVSLLRTLEPTDTVITLNYDLVADVALRSIEVADNGKELPQDSRLGKLPALVGTANFWGGVPPSLLPREAATGFFLKLHGSLDWLRCSTLGCPNNQRLFAVGSESLREGQEAGRPCRLCGSALEVFIVPPVASKRIDDRGRLAFLWNMAFRELREATHVVVVGLSFAASDFELRWLLQASGVARELEKLSIVNPSEPAREAARMLLASASTEVDQYTGLSDFVEFLASSCGRA